MAPSIERRNPRHRSAAVAISVLRYERMARDSSGERRPASFWSAGLHHFKYLQGSEPVLADAEERLFAAERPS